MSFKAVKWAYEQHGMTPGQKSVLVAIAFHFNEDEHCAWPSYPKLAEETELDRVTVWRAVHALDKQLGLVVVESRRSDGRQTSNQYWLPDYDPQSKPSRATFTEAPT
ncbi:hypothetical protein DEJ00_01410 [Curtobacterium sp. MCLR17_039]|uniref:helix-turn-helix domain-containing protein n=1 Tax=Curtobacterium sp. MCLR17_039 TaxID=2175624 RepID=UPI000DA7D6AB|nr:helix-turn-helix domain-containing protein [Curtobacterium sp. MCLR17_039]PZE93904.1 hypothetical protein DEJ00_01410 [Curtobacterium sp. MCLR17_039]